MSNILKVDAFIEGKNRQSSSQINFFIRSKNNDKNRWEMGQLNRIKKNSGCWIFGKTRNKCFWLQYKIASLQNSMIFMKNINIFFIDLRFHTFNSYSLTFYQTRTSAGNSFSIRYLDKVLYLKLHYQKNASDRILSSIVDW